MIAGLPAAAGGIEWSAKGPYEACLESQADTWLTTKAALIVANDEGARALNDGDVAGFTIETMKACQAKGAPASEASDADFGKYMARWRAHIYELAKAARTSGGSD